MFPAIVHRGPHAFGWSYWTGSHICWEKHPGKVDTPTNMAKLEAPEDIRWMMGHVRFYTHGSPEFNYNNHPIIHRNIIGVHNGVVRNYDSILKVTGREDDRAQVDSEAIFAGIQHYGIRKGLDKIRGDAAIAFVDDRRPESMYVGRTTGRPLVYARTAAGSFIFASEDAVLDSGMFTLAGKTYSVAAPWRIMRVTAGNVDKRIRLTPQSTWGGTSSYSGSSGSGSGKGYTWHRDGKGFTHVPTRNYYDGDKPYTPSSSSSALTPRQLGSKVGGSKTPTASGAGRQPKRGGLTTEELSARSPVRFDHDLTQEEVLADLNARPMIRNAIKDMPNGAYVDEFFVWDGRLVSEDEYVDLAQREMDLAALFAEQGDAS